MGSVEEDYAVGVPQPGLGQGRTRRKGNAPRVSCAAQMREHQPNIRWCMQAPNIMAMIQRFNVVSRWVATEIVQVEDITLRASVLNHFLEVMNVRAQRRVTLVAHFVYSSTRLALLTPGTHNRSAMHGAQQLQLLHGDHIWPAVLLGLPPQADVGGI